MKCTISLSFTAEPIYVNCGNKRAFDMLRYMRGSRYNEFYIDIRGFGPHDNWYTVYNLTSSLKVFSKDFNDK